MELAPASAGIGAGFCLWGTGSDLLCASGGLKKEGCHEEKTKRKVPFWLPVLLLALLLAALLSACAGQGRRCRSW